MTTKRMRKGGGFAGPGRGSQKGPLRDIIRRINWSDSIFAPDLVVLSCGHQGPATMGARRARCAKCKKEEKP